MNTTAPDNTAAAYLRQSSYTTGSISTDIQLANCRKVAEQYGFEIVFVDQDVDISGTHTNRPGLERLRAAKKAGKFKHLILDDLSRLSRSQSDALVLQGEFESIVTSKEGRVDNKIINAIYNAINESFIDNIKIRWNDALRNRFERGLLPSGNQQWGYTKNAEGFYIPDANAQYVKKMYKDYISGIGARTIALELNTKGVLSPNGKQWTTTTVFDLLDKSFYSGVISFMGEERQGIHEPLISVGQWKAYKEARSSRRQKKQRKDVINQFEGLLHCARCGSPTTTNSRGILCTRYMNLGPTACEGVFLDMNVVYSAFNIFFTESDGYTKYTEALPSVDQDKQKAEADLLDARALLEKAEEDYQGYQLFAYENNVRGEMMQKTLASKEQAITDAQAKVDEVEAQIGKLSMIEDDPLSKWTNNKLGTEELSEQEESAIYNQAMRRLFSRIVIHPRAYDVPRDPRRFPETEVEFIFANGETFRLTEDYMLARQWSEDTSMLYRLIEREEVSKTELAKRMGVHHAGPFTRRVSRWVEAGVLVLRIEGPRKHLVRLNPERLEAWVPKID